MYYYLRNSTYINSQKNINSLKEINYTSIPGIITNLTEYKPEELQIEIVDSQEISIELNINDVQKIEEKDEEIVIVEGNENKDQLINEEKEVNINKLEEIKEVKEVNINKLEELKEVKEIKINKPEEIKKINKTILLDICILIGLIFGIEFNIQNYMYINIIFIILNIKYKL